MTPTIDYSASADLFARKGKSRQLAHRRFATASRAIQYTIEELGEDFLKGTVLQIDDERFEGAQIRGLYDDPAYPLNRSATARASAVINK